jgi:hypothetical protein
VHVLSEHLLLVVSSLTVDVLYGVGLWAILIVVPAAVTLMKGQNALFAAGLLLLGLVWAIAAFRLARPGSYWARKFYGPDKLKRSVRRYGDVQAP